MTDLDNFMKAFVNAGYYFEVDASERDTTIICLTTEKKPFFFHFEKDGELIRVKDNEIDDD